MGSITLSKVVKRFGEAEVIPSLDLGIREGEFVVFVGPSGCGKSTLLRMIAGLEDLTEGNIEIGGRDVSHLAPGDRGLAMVFQSYALYPHMTVRENMLFPLEMAKVDARTARDKVARAAEVLNLSAYMDRKPGQLSGGQRQRVAIGRAIVRDPKVYLFDEPLSNLDAALRVATRIEIAQLKEQMPERTMIYVTHDQVEAMTLASRIVVLANKGVAQVGTPLELYETPNSEFVAQFIGSPAMNLLPGEVIDTGPRTTVQLPGGGTALSDVATEPDDMGLKVNVGIRPEDFVIAEDAGVYTGTVALTEALGEVTLLHFEGDGAALEPVIAKLPGIHRGLRGTEVRLTADPAKVHLFAEGQSLLYR